MEKLEELRAVFEQGDWAALEQGLVPFAFHRMDPDTRAACGALLREIPEGIQKSSAVFCLSLALDALWSGNQQEGQRWQGSLTALRDAAKEGSEERGRLDQASAWLSLQFPQTGHAQMLRIMSVLAYERQGELLEYGPISVTGGLPSVLRGAKDLSEWGRNYRAVRSMIRPMLGSLLAEDGRGVCEAAVAELLYEKNRIGEAAVVVSGALNSSEPEILFAGMAQLARINRLDPSAEAPEAVLERLEKRLIEMGAGYLTENMRALAVRLRIEAGTLDGVEDWLRETEAHSGPNNCYLSLIRAKAEIALGRYPEALTLLEPIRERLTGEIRPMDQAECLANQAVAYALSGDEEQALNRLEQAAALLRPYGYIRVLADLGAPMRRLLERYREKKGDSYLDAVGKAFQKLDQPEEPAQPEVPADAAVPNEPEQPIQPADTSAELEEPDTPAEPPEPAGDSEAPPVEELTPEEREVLKLAVEGKANNEIAELLSVRPAVVKLHLKGIMSKLGIGNRAEIAEAAERAGLL